MIILAALCVFLAGVCLGLLIAEISIRFAGIKADRELEKMLRGRE